MSVVTWSGADPLGFCFLTSTEGSVSNFPLSPAAPVSFTWKNIRIFPSMFMLKPVHGQQGFYGNPKQQQKIEVIHCSQMQ